MICRFAFSYAYVLVYKVTDVSNKLAFFVLLFQVKSYLFTVFISIQSSYIPYIKKRPTDNSPEKSRADIQADRSDRFHNSPGTIKTPFQIIKASNAHLRNKRSTYFNRERDRKPMTYGS